MKISFSTFNIFFLSTNLFWAAAGSLRPDAETRIVNGEQANVGEFPYYVDLMDCGGTLITPTIVLTAVHCEVWRKLGHSVLVGAHRSRRDVDGAEWIEVIDVEDHDDYHYNSDYDTDTSVYMLNDIALMRLAKPYYLPDNFKLNLADESTENLQDGDPLTVIGLGYEVEDSYQRATYLQHVEVPFINMDTCLALHDGNWIQEETNICAGTEGKGNCNGDSGGPLVRVDSNNEHTLVGVVSWSEFGCEDVEIYERVAANREWIHYTVCEVWGAYEDCDLL